jgi:hypothetical protein
VGEEGVDFDEVFWQENATDMFRQYEPDQSKEGVIEVKNINK